MIPELDFQIGILVYTTKFKGIGGKIRENPEDFQVTEIISGKSQNLIQESGDYPV